MKIASVAGDFSVSVAKKLGLDKVLADLNRKFDGIGNTTNRTVGLDRLPCCFVAGTSIKTTDGYKNIEDLKVGDEVLSQNVETGAIETSLVTDTHIRPISEIKTFYKLTVGVGSQNEDLFVTGEHPFWVTDKQEWITVDEIQVGARLTNHQGEELSVQAKVLQTELQQTYNITVSGNNNYFAGKLETLVHNCGEIVGRTANGRPIHAVGRDGGTNLFVQAPNGSYVSAQRYDLATGMGRPSVSDNRLNRIVNDNYRPNAQIGSGSTADAVRHEITTGQQVGGRTHTQKAQEQITRLNNWIQRNPNGSQGDIRTAQNMIIDLEDALATPRP
jgi:hypothetical protein